MVVPVWLSHKDVPSKETLVYAILDNQSDTSFILEKTIWNFHQQKLTCYYLPCLLRISSSKALG